MMNRTECDVNVARHARRIDYSNQVGWLHDAPAAPNTKWTRTFLAGLFAWMSPSRRTRLANAG